MAQKEQHPFERVGMIMKDCIKFFPIEYPKIQSEFEIQADLYVSLKKLGFDVRGEVRSECVDYGRIGKTRFDLVIFSHLKLPMMIIECKNDFKEKIDLNNGTRQRRRYEMFGVPVLKFGGKNKEEFLKIVEEKLKEIEGF